MRYNTYLKDFKLKGTNLMEVSMNKARLIRVRGIFSYILFVLLVMLMTTFTGLTSDITFANSAEPPALIIVVPGATDDLTVYIEGTSGLLEGRKVHYFTETQFMFYKNEIPSTDTQKITVKSKAQQFELFTKKGMNRYRSVYTIDTYRQTIIEGTTAGREAILVGARVGLTLLIEGAIFWLFGFRSRRSWVMFILINLFTQGVLNLWLGFQPMAQSYLILSLVFAEAFVLIGELFLFNAFVKEHTVAKRNFYVAIANFASLVLGGYLIAWLPI